MTSAHRAGNRVQRPTITIAERKESSMTTIADIAFDSDRGQRFAPEQPLAATPLAALAATSVFTGAVAAYAVEEAVGN